MSGKVQGIPSEANDLCYESNLKYAVQLLEKENILGLIEPINMYSIPTYYMNCYDKGTSHIYLLNLYLILYAFAALSVVKKIQSPNLKIMLDIFHMQHIRGNITNSLQELKDYCGHVQIAQVPNRNEPNTLGEINYKYVLEELKQIGYNDWIGLEYKPLKDSKQGLNWISEFGYSL